MTDQELLVYAAKAAGLEYASGHWLGIINDRFPNERNSLYIREAHDEYVEWNPLLSDADAFRLSVSLRLPVVYLPNSPPYEPPRVVISLGSGIVENVLDDNWHAATRRAIVRAAAEIGRNMTE